jgi:hypothetical protein
MGGVVEGIALEMEHARAAPIIGGIADTPAPIAKVAAIGQDIRAAAVLLAAYVRTKPRRHETAKITNELGCPPRDEASPFDNHSANPLDSRPRPSAMPPLLVVEILSPSTRKVDRGAKLAHPD